jgi:hypothetical protein
MSDVSGLIALMMEAVNTSETSVNIYQTTQSKISKKRTIFILIALKT